MPDSSKLFGIDRQQFVALLKLHLKLDFRPRSAPQNTKKRLIPQALLPFVVYGWFGFFLALSLLTKGASTQVYAFFVISYTMVMVFFAVLHEFDIILINPDDMEIIGYRPVHSKTFSAAKLANFVIYISLLSASLTFLPGAIAFFLNESTVIYPFLLFFSASVSSLVTGFFVVILYTLLLQRISAVKLKEFITYMQVGFTLVIFLVYQLIPRIDPRVLQSGFNDVSLWFLLAPSVWFTGFTEIFSKNPDLFIIYASFAGVIASIIVIFTGGMKFSAAGAGYLSEKLKESESVSVKPGTVSQKAGFGKSSETKAGYFLTMLMIKRDRSVKAGILSLSAIVAASALMSYFDGTMTDPFIKESGTGFSYAFMFSIFIVFAFINFIQYSTDWEGAWVFKISPMRNPGKLYRGANAVILSRVLVPVYLVVFAVYLLRIRFFHAFLQIVVMFVFGVLSLCLGLFLVKDFPFSKKRVRGQRSRSLGMIFYTVPVLILYVVSGKFIYRGGLYYILSVCVLILLSFAVEYFAVRRLGQVIDKSEDF
ncbi:hypothetical protein DRQ07_03525 [candidate division KSB1 bacterium]|nr:MAG: hypothetical protein DRQ07_03525 [candidate division KSB1 bacterium]